MYHILHTHVYTHKYIHINIHKNVFYHISSISLDTAVNEIESSWAHRGTPRVVCGVFLLEVECDVDLFGEGDNSVFCSDGARKEECR